MLDQDTAIALLTTAAEAGATIALVGDRAQLPAVGRGGVLDIAAAITTGTGGTVHDLDTVHRFADPDYADLTLKMRAGHDSADLFDQLNAMGLVQLHTTAEQAHEQIADATTHAIATGRTVAATVATNDEAHNLNERVRKQRITSGSVDDTSTGTGRDGLPIGVGDVIATRKNDSNLGVANRQTWTVQHVGPDGALTVVEAAKASKHHRSITLPSSYVAEHVHLAYANTGYGVQGVTNTAAHTLLSESLDAAGVYVGMTRGRNLNVLHIVAESLADAREQFADAMERDRADRGLHVATTHAQAAVAGLAADGPVRWSTTSDRASRNSSPRPSKRPHAGTAPLLSSTTKHRIMRTRKHRRAARSGKPGRTCRESATRPLRHCSLKPPPTARPTSTPMRANTKLGRPPSRPAASANEEPSEGSPPPEPAPARRRLPYSIAGAACPTRAGGESRPATALNPGPNALRPSSPTPRPRSSRHENKLSKPKRHSGRPVRAIGTRPRLWRSASLISATPVSAEGSPGRTPLPAARNAGTGTPTSSAPTSPASNPSPSDEPSNSSRRAGLKPSRSSEQPPPAATLSARRRSTRSTEEIPSSAPASSPEIISRRSTRDRSVTTGPESADLEAPGIADER